MADVPDPRTVARRKAEFAQEALFQIADAVCNYTFHTALGKKLNTFFAEVYSNPYFEHKRYDADYSDFDNTRRKLTGRYRFTILERGYDEGVLVCDDGRLFTFLYDVRDDGYMGIPATNTYYSMDDAELLEGQQLLDFLRQNLEVVKHLKFDVVEKVFEKI